MSLRNKKVLIIGGVAGGASTAARIRRLDENAEIIMFERGDYISYANCGLPYYIGGEITKKTSLTLQTPESFNNRFAVDVRIRQEVIAIDRINKSVTVKKLDTQEEYTEQYDVLVLSMGAEPIIPPIPGVNSSRVYTLRTIPDTLQIKEHLDCYNPKSAVVVGAGFIGIEMAENLHRAGLNVTIVEMQNQIIAPIDFDIACDLHNHIRSKGVNLMLGCALQSINETSSGLEIETSAGTISADIIIMAIGVKPESDLAQKAGLTLNDRRGIVVDDHMRTSDPCIYALGDAVEVTDSITKQKAMIPLAGPANKQGRIVADNICGGNSTYKGTQGSSILRVFDMTAASTGINEKTAKRLGIEYEKSFTFSGSHAGYYPGANNMSVKLLFNPVTSKILGAQIVGYSGVDKRCDIIATAIGFGATIKDLTKIEHCYAPPFSSAKDPVNMAGFVAENITTGKVALFHWNDVEEVLKQPDTILLDVRTEKEFSNGHIDGSVNIPLDSLRDRIGELNQNKKLYVTCQVGLRGYLACRILTQKGYSCRNLSGGYRLYKSIFQS